MWRTFTVIVTVLLLAFAAMFALAANDQPAASQTQQDKLQSRHLGAETQLSNRVLHDQVSLCNLVDALWLEDDQLVEIIAILEQHIPEVERHYVEMEATFNDERFEVTYMYRVEKPGFDIDLTA